MRRYGGTLVFRTRDPHGVIEVVEDSRTRSLHFGSESKQSSMDLHDPERLELSYTRAMAAALLFVAEPRAALLLGLGGGSLAKFLLRHTGCRVDAVELRPAVVEVAREQFLLPEDPRLRVFVSDACAWLAGRPAEAGYDLLFVDAYDAEGMSPGVHGRAYLEAVHDQLFPGGVAVFNLWTDEPEALEALLGQLKELFGNILLLPVEGKANLIAMCGKKRPLRWELRRLGDRAKALEAQSGMEFVTLLKGLRKHNTLFLGNIFF